VKYHLPTTRVLRPQWSFPAQCFGLFLFFLLTLSELFAQAPAPKTTKSQEPKMPVIVVIVERVIVPVTVKDSRGRLINDLKKKDFELFEDGVPQEVSDFSTDPRALSAVILLDTAMSERAERQITETLRSLTESFSDFDELAVYTFEDRVDKLVEFGNDRDVAFKKLKKVVEVSGTSAAVPGGPIFNGTTPSVNGRPIDVGPLPNYSSLKPPVKRITDAIFTAALALKGRPKEHRKVILVISDGNNTGKNESSFEDTLRLLLDNNVAVFGIAPDQIPLIQHAEIYNVLPKFADQTGGGMFYSFKRETLENVYSSLTEEVRNQYELTYSPKRHTDDDVFKSIEVRVNRPGLQVITRQGYYAVSIVPLTPPEK
jgi:VWFA-related protein